MSRVSWSDAFRCRAQKLWVAHCCSKQQRLYFLPLPQGQGSFLPILPFPGESIMSTHYPPKSGKTRAEVHAFVDFLLSIRLPPCSRERRQCSGRRRVINCWLLEVAKHISTNCQHRTRGKSGPPWRGARKKPAGQGRRAGQLFAAMAHRSPVTRILQTRPDSR